MHPNYCCPEEADSNNNAAVGKATSQFYMARGVVSNSPVTVYVLAAKATQSILKYFNG
jgi:hypothetical protein